MNPETCLDDSTTTQLLLGTLPANLAEVGEQHLLNCQSCLDRAQALSVEDELITSLRSSPDPGSTCELDSLVNELEKLGGSAQIAASAREEITAILGQPHSSDELGRLLHFRILEVLGAGGMGIVFKAEDGQLNRTVAIKAMRPSLAVDPEAKQRFRREAMAVAAFEHDNVVTIYQVEETRGIPFFSMQWLEGESLKERLHREGQLPIGEVLRITREIANGLVAAHERGLLHRDVKPDNIWLQAPEGRVKILDFGLVRSIEERSSLTHSGAILGTPEYMAPEQACGEEVDERCDLFSVGCVMYHMLTGTPPFKAKNVVATLVAISNAKVEPPHRIAPEIPSPVSELCVSLLQRAPEDRVSSAEELSDYVRQLEANETLSPATSARDRHVHSKRADNASATSQPPAGDRGDAGWWQWLCFAAIAVVAGVIAYQTNHGTLYIDADDNMVTTIDGDAVTLLDKSTKKKIQLSVGKNRLRAGDYEIVAQNEATDFAFSAKEFTIRRSGRKDVRVWLETPESLTKASTKPGNSSASMQVDTHSQADTQSQESDTGTDVRDPKTQLQKWLVNLRSLGENAKQQREQALTEIRAAMDGSNSAHQLAALSALGQTADVTYDKQAFREQILRYTSSNSGDIQKAAFYALLADGPKPGDLELLRKTLNQPHEVALTYSASHLLHMFGEGKIEDESERIVLELLANKKSGVRREALRGLWGAHISDRLAARLIELADIPESRHDAIYFGLSTLPHKNADVVDKLIETLADPDPNDWGRALWGLGYGVPKSEQSKVAAAMGALREARTDPRTRNKADALIQRYGTGQTAGTKTNGTAVADASPTDSAPPVSAPTVSKSTDSKSTTAKRNTPPLEIVGMYVTPDSDPKTGVSYLQPVSAEGHLVSASAISKEEAQNYPRIVIGPDLPDWRNDDRLAGAAEIAKRLLPKWKQRRRKVQEIRESPEAGPPSFAIIMQKGTAVEWGPAPSTQSESDIEQRLAEIDRREAVTPLSPSEMAARPATDTKLPAWHTGISESFGVATNQPLSPLSLVQKPTPKSDYVSWTRETRSHRGSVTAIAAWPGDRLTATGGEDGTVRIWNTSGKQRLIVCPDTEKGVHAIAWSHDGTMLAAATEKSLTIWDIALPWGVPKFRCKLQRRARQLAWSGTTLAFSDQDGVHLWADDELVPNAGMTGDISTRPWSHDGRYLACLESDVIRIWNMTDGKVHAAVALEMESRSNSISEARAPVFDPKFGYFAFVLDHFQPNSEPTKRERYYYSSSSKKYDYSEILIYDVRNAVRVKSLKLKRKPTDYTWNPDGSGLTYIDSNEVHTINLSTEKISTTEVPRTQPSGRKYVNQCEWASLPDGDQLNVVHSGNAWSWRDNQWTHIAGPELEIITDSVADRLVARTFHAGERDVFGYLPGTLEVWDTRSLKRLMQLAPTGPVSFELSPDGQRLLLVSDERRIEVYDVQEGKLFETMVGDRVYAARWVPSGDRFYAATENGRVIFNGKTGELQHRDLSAYTISDNHWWSHDGTRFLRNPDRREFGGEPVAAVVMNADNFHQERALRFVNQITVEAVLARLEAEKSRIETKAKSFQDKLRTARSNVEELLTVVPDADRNSSLPKNIIDLHTAILDTQFNVYNLEANVQHLQTAIEMPSDPRTGPFQVTLLEVQLSSTPPLQNLQRKINRLKAQRVSAAMVAPNRFDEEEDEPADDTPAAKELADLQKRYQATRISAALAARRRGLRFNDTTQRKAEFEAELKSSKSRLAELEAEYKSAMDNLNTGNPVIALPWRLHQLEHVTSELNLLAEYKSQLDRIVVDVERQKARPTTSTITSAATAWSPNDRYVVAIGADRSKQSVDAYIWDLKDVASGPMQKIPIQTMERSSRLPGALVHFSPNSQRFSVQIEDTVYMIDMISEKKIERRIDDLDEVLGWLSNETLLVRDRENVLKITWSRDGMRRLPVREGVVRDDKLFASNLGTVQRWNAAGELESTVILERVDMDTDEEAIRLNVVTATGELRSSDPDATLPTIGIQKNNQFRFQELP